MYAVKVRKKAVSVDSSPTNVCYFQFSLYEVNFNEAKVRNYQ